MVAKITGVNYTTSHYHRRQNSQQHQRYSVTTTNDKKLQTLQNTALYIATGWTLHQHSTCSQRNNDTTAHTWSFINLQLGSKYQEPSYLLHSFSKQNIQTAFINYYATSIKIRKHVILAQTKHTFHSFMKCIWHTNNAYFHKPSCFIYINVR